MHFKKFRSHILAPNYVNLFQVSQLSHFLIQYLYQSQYPMERLYFFFSASSCPSVLLESSLSSARVGMDVGEEQRSFLSFLATWCLNHTGRGLTVTALLSFFSHFFFHFFSSSPVQKCLISILTQAYGNLIRCFMVLSNVVTIVFLKNAG